MTPAERQRLREQHGSLRAEAARRLAKRTDHRWCPHRPMPRQQQFLDIDADEALYGGAAGGGKSDALLMSQLRWADVPGFAGLLLRQSYADLALPGAIMDRAADWLRPTAAQWSDKSKRWTFPSGASLSFGYLQTEVDKYRYQSAEFQEIGFDELTQFPASQYTYLSSRLRRLQGFAVKPRMRAATNPGGRGHQWVHARFVDEKTARFPFVPALLSDNPFIDRDDYRARLGNLDSTTTAQLRDGEWVQDQQSLIYPYGPDNVIPVLPDLPDDGGLYRVLAVDLGAREDKPTTAFGVLTWHRQLAGVFVVWSDVYAGLTVTDIAERIKEYQAAYGAFTQIVVDEGALGKAYGKEFRTRHHLHTEPAEKAGKLAFRKVLRAGLERHELMIVGPENEGLLAEMSDLRWDARGLDNEPGSDNHLTDVLLYGYRACTAYAARPPEPRPAKGSRAAADAEEKRMLDEERRAAIRAQRNTRDKNWWQK